MTNSLQVLLFSGGSWPIPLGNESEPGVHRSEPPSAQVLLPMRLLQPGDLVRTRPQANSRRDVVDVLPYSHRNVIRITGNVPRP